MSIQKYHHLNQKFKRGQLNFSVYWGEAKHRWRKHPIWVGMEFVQVDAAIKTTIEFSIVCRIKDIPDFVYKYAHCDECMTQEGLLAELCVAYDQLREMSKDRQLEEGVQIVGYRLPA